MGSVRKMGRTAEQDYGQQTTFTGRKFLCQSFNENELNNAMESLENWAFDEKQSSENIQYENIELKLFKNQTRLNSDNLENWDFDENDDTKEDSGFEEDESECETNERKSEKTAKQLKSNALKKSLLQILFWGNCFPLQKYLFK